MFHFLLFINTSPCTVLKHQGIKGARGALPSISSSVQKTHLKQHLFQEGATGTGVGVVPKTPRFHFCFVLPEGTMSCPNPGKSVPGVILFPLGAKHWVRYQP